MSILYFGKKDCHEIRKCLLKQNGDIDQIKNDIYLFEFIIGPKFKKEFDIFDATIQGSAKLYEILEEGLLKSQLFEYSLVLVEWLKFASEKNTNQATVYYLIPASHKNRKITLNTKADKVLLIQPKSHLPLNREKLQNISASVGKIDWQTLKEREMEGYQFCSNFYTKENFYFEKFAKKSMKSLFMHNVTSEDERISIHNEKLFLNLSVPKQSVFSIEQITKYMKSEWSKILSLMIGLEENKPLTKYNKFTLISMRDLNKSLETFYHEEFFFDKPPKITEDCFNTSKFFKLLVCHMGKEVFVENSSTCLLENTKRFVFYGILSYLCRHVKEGYCIKCSHSKGTASHDHQINASSFVKMPLEEKTFVIPQNIVTAVNKNNAKYTGFVHKASGFLEKIGINDTKIVVFTLMMLLK